MQINLTGKARLRCVVGKHKVAKVRNRIVRYNPKNRCYKRR